MKPFRRLLADIRRGENLDLYLAASTAIVVVALSVVGLDTTPWINSITLAVLAVMALSSLQGRHQVGDLIGRLAKTSDDLFLDEFPPDFKADLEASRDLLVTGVSLAAAMTNYYALLKTKAQRGDRIRALLVHPEGVAREIAAARSPWDEGLQSKIESSLEALSRIRDLAPDNVEIRTIRYPLSYSGFLMNLGPSSSQGILYVEYYPYKSPFSCVPKHVIRQASNKWFGVYVAEILDLWEDSEPFQYLGSH